MRQNRCKVSAYGIGSLEKRILIFASQTGGGAFTWIFRNTAALNSWLVNGYGCTKAERKLYADFLCNGKFAHFADFTRTAAAGSDDRRTAAKGSAGTCFGKGNDFDGYTDEIGLEKCVAAGDGGFLLLVAACVYTGFCGFVKNRKLRIGIGLIGFAHRILLDRLTVSYEKGLTV